MNVEHELSDLQAQPRIFFWVVLEAIGPSHCVTKPLISPKPDRGQFLPPFLLPSSSYHWT